jgi:hypothetical protein
MDFRSVSYRSYFNGVLRILPLGWTTHFSLAKGLPFNVAIIQSATKVGGNGPRLAEGTLPTEWRDS